MFAHRDIRERGTTPRDDEANACGLRMVVETAEAASRSRCGDAANSRWVGSIETVSFRLPLYSAARYRAALLKLVRTVGDSGQL